jgi:hypothetical protein
MAQLALGASVAPQVVLDELKSAAFAPVTAIEVMLIVALPVLLSVIACAEEESPTLIPPKDSDEGLKLATGA